MEKRYIIAFIVYAIVIIGLWGWWAQRSQPPPMPQLPVETKKETTPKIERKPPPPEEISKEILPREITVENNFYRIVLTSHGGCVKQIFLKKYHHKKGKEIKLLPLREIEESFCLGLLGCTAEDKFTYLKAVYKTTSPEEILVNEKNPCQQVKFTRRFNSGLEITKTFTFRHQNYLINLEVVVRNTRQEPLSLGQEGGYRLVWGPEITSENPNKAKMYLNTLWLKDEQAKFNKLGISKKGTVNCVGIKWIGFKNKYFASLLIPLSRIEAGEVFSFRGKEAIGLRMPALYLQPGEKQVDQFLVYAGPLKYDALIQLKDNQGNSLKLEKAVYLGWSVFRGISIFMLKILNSLYHYTHNYGLAIILLTLMVKIILFPTTHWSMKSMKEMQKLQPYLNEIKKRHKNDPQRMNQETMELYRRHRVNPLGGCFPMLLQMPVFIALFGTLSYAIELRGASFLLWIKDLSEPDTLFRIGGFSVNLLPILMAATTIIQSKLSPTTPAGSDHAKMMTYFMPLFMMFIFWNFPSGLVLYWLMMNVFTICQQLLTQGIKK